MEESLQELLRKAWLGGRDGNLSALSEARAWALREVWRSTMLSQSGLEKVTLAYCILAAHARKQTPGALGHAHAHRKHAHAHHPNTNKAKNVKHKL